MGGASALNARDILAHVLLSFSFDVDLLVHVSIVISSAYRSRFDIDYPVVVLLFEFVARSLRAPCIRVVVIPQTASICLRRLARILIQFRLFHHFGQHWSGQGRLRVSAIMPLRRVHLFKEFPSRVSSLIGWQFSLFVSAGVFRSTRIFILRLRILLISIVGLELGLVNCFQPRIFRVRIRLLEEVVHRV